MTSSLASLMACFMLGLAKFSRFIIRKIKAFVLPFFTSLAILCVSGCSSSSSILNDKRLQDKRITQNQILYALSIEYRKLAESYYDASDVRDAQYFIDKAASLANGLVEPEDPKTWGVSSELNPELYHAREDLMYLMQDYHLIETQASILASLQVSYDCWVKDTELLRLYNSSSCFKRFVKNLNYISKYYLEHEKDRKLSFNATIKENYSLVKTKPNILRLSIFFDEKSSTMPSQISDGLDKVVDFAAMYEDYEIVIEGHTDRIGFPAENDAISAKRAITVKQELIKYGIDETRIKVLALSDRYPKIATKPSTLQRYNRRVEVRVVGVSFVN